jgi:hypothetical protein
MSIPAMHLGPFTPRLIDYQLERENELAQLALKDDELSARIEELSGFRVGMVWEKTRAIREELVQERRATRNRMLAIGSD